MKTLPTGKKQLLTEQRIEVAERVQRGGWASYADALAQMARAAFNA